MQVIPVLNCLDRADAEEKIAIAKNFSKKKIFFTLTLRTEYSHSIRHGMILRAGPRLHSPFPLGSSSDGGASRSMDRAMACGGRKTFYSSH